MGPRYGEEKAYRPREWSVRKLAYLKAYLEAYLRATSRALQRYYIDCFAGRGAWQTEDGQEFKGSPLQAIEARAAAGVMFTQLHFIELRLKVHLGTLAGERRSGLGGRESLGPS